MSKRPVRAGLDIGIGSIGWTVISGSTSEDARIEDLGVRIYESGEMNNGKDRKSQERRGFRGTRRGIRRRYYRKERLKTLLKQLGMLPADEIKNYPNIYSIKIKALDNKISLDELAACLINACNHRGYSPFYEDSDDNITEESEENKQKNKEEKENIAAMHNFDSVFRKSGCRTVSEFLDKYFIDKKTGFPVFKNRIHREEHLLIRREYILNETQMILDSQKRYYPQLTENVIDSIKKVIFTQRTFEDGPGNASDAYRRYTNFLDTIGHCPFYKDKMRGFRCTVIADIYALVNTLSQYRFIDKKTGDFYLPPAAAEEIINLALENASFNLNEIKKLLKTFGIDMQKPQGCDDKALNKSMRFLNMAKKAVENAEESWESVINEEQFDVSSPSKLSIISNILARNITPSRRKAKLAELPFISERLAGEFAKIKSGGTSAVSDDYMCDAIEAFMHGEIYGNFQANMIRERQKDLEKPTENARSIKLLPDVLRDEEIEDNPVVFRAINETRKLINAITGTYGPLEYINIEIASELNRSYLERKNLEKINREHEKIRDDAAEEIVEIAGEKAKNSANIDKYLLYQQQEGKSPYSGKPLGDIKDILTDKSNTYEIDHIIPESLILDNTLQNKALVFGSENQYKKQRTPLMYLKGNESVDFKAFVNHMYTRKANPISKKKYAYFMLDDLYSEEAQAILLDWKSRNINDTRYITKYIISLLEKNLKFSGSHSHPVYGIKGAITSKYRRKWLNGKTWGKEDKERSTYLNHTADSIIIANLTRPYVEIASDSEKLYRIKRNSGKSLSISSEYTDFLNSCIHKMKKYYGFPEEYTQRLLTNNGRIPSFIKDIQKETDIRLNDSDVSVFNKQINEFYGSCNAFTVKPHMVMTSQKQEKRFRGQITDSNPIKIREIDGTLCKISRKNIADITQQDIDKLYTKDKDLRDTLTRILNGKDKEYTIGEYLEENNLTKFTTDLGHPVYKVSYKERTIANFYKKDIGSGNYSMFAEPSYYCIDIYKDGKGKTKTFGVRYVDIIKNNGKLMLLESTLPKDYAQHVCYLQKNDYIEVIDASGKLKVSGYYSSVKTMSRNNFYYRRANMPKAEVFSITSGDTVKKYAVDILGRKGGEIKCSAPLSLTKESTSVSKKIGLWSWKKKRSGASR